MKLYKKNLKKLVEGNAYDPKNEHDACGVGFIASTENKKSRKVRHNQHTLFMETQNYILSLAKQTGFILKGKIDMRTCQYEYQYIYIMYKPL